MASLPHLQKTQQGVVIYMQIELISQGAAAVIDTKGAELTSLKDVFDTEYIWCGDKKYWGRHSPILFPVVGEQKNGEYTYEGKTYKISRHGFVRDSEFEVLRSDKSSCLLSFSANEETKKQFPFDFTFQAAFSLEGTELSVKYTVLNMGSDSMYFAIGGHTGYNCPLCDDESFSDYFIGFDKKETFSRLLLSEKGLFNGKSEKFIENSNEFSLNHEMFDKDAVVPDKLESKAVTLQNKRTGRGVRVEFDDFETLAVWSPEGNSPFVCLEPWNGRASSESDSSDLTAKDGIIKLEAEKSYSVSHKIILL